MIKRDAQADDLSQTLPFPKPTSTTEYNIGDPCCIGFCNNKRAHGVTFSQRGPQREAIKQKEKQNPNTECCSQPLRTGSARESQIKDWLGKGGSI